MTPAEFEAQAAEYERLAAGTAFPLDRSRLYPCLGDDAAQAGTWPAHYGHADLWAARRVVSVCKSSASWSGQTHFDVGSRLDGFVAHVLASGVPVTVIDVRPLSVTVRGLAYERDDATTLATFPSGCISSLSAIHSLEHFGLGRYGDAIDPDAPSRALMSFARVLAPGGRLYLAVPIGRERVEFNAHRVFDPRTIPEACEMGPLTLREFAAIDDAGNFHEGANPADYDGAEYACGCYLFTKRDR